ncbi:hypothetical protein A3K82_01360 [Candidatus Pacearchaeota archaeon RBG_19FT_COMBO_34_9]|nr:MAG: hypothetical protein A3K82_01360 [Candidatus Pacearchaeota archaeon RBG_19FT_COMBO_34_9]OGJ16917.1 MAG: hypothetical protein A3K74_02150 [Candidatus Pacearchaeota archaeon RBG_13_33_26]
METKFDKVIRKYSLLQKLDPENRLLEYFTKDEEGFLPNPQRREEFVDRFGTYYSSPKELTEDEEKVPTRRGIAKILLTNYNETLIIEIKRLRDLSKGIIKLWGAEI